MEGDEVCPWRTWPGQGLPRDECDDDLPDADMASTLGDSTGPGDGGQRSNVEGSTRPIEYVTWAL